MVKDSAQSRYKSAKRGDDYLQVLQTNESQARKDLEMRVTTNGCRLEKSDELKKKLGK